MPGAVFANDTANKTLVATASADQHERIAATVQQMDRPNAQEPALQAYAITKANVQTVYQALDRMYRRNSQVAITLDEANHSLLVKAPAADHQTIAQIVSQMENGAASGQQRTLVVYSTDASDAESTLATFQSLLKDQQPPVELSLNERTRQLVAVATPQQHAILSAAARQIQREPYLVEVFALQSADPFTVESAIERLYEDETSKPIADGDSETQQLFVRGTRQQLDEVRQLLTQMGELPAQDLTSQRGMRVIQFRGDVDDAVRQLEEVWPKLRQNRLQVIRPGDAQPNLRPVAPRVESVKPDADDSNRADGSNHPDPKDDAAAPRRPMTQTLLTAGQTPSENDQPRSQSSEPAPDNAPPLVIIAGENSITLLSDDEAALRQAEALMRTLARQSRSDSGTGNFAVYTLRNAGARSVTRLMTDLFKQMPITTRAAIGRVSMVADERLNAVVVYGRQADRAVITELLRVLDSSNVPDSLANARPVIVPIEYLEASSVLEILRGVYESQMTSGGRRPEIEIPEGVSDEVASLLRQINAASSGPLLTLEVDDVTNSIVILAPSQLSNEVSLLAKQLDENARQNDSKEIGIVTLQHTNVNQLQRALNDLLRSTRNRR
jgi:type II secretory pathway component GspD/PulD (secretin)